MTFSSTLPVQLSSFVGRERECVELVRLLDGVRLLTLLGTGGIGKTRLALEVARAVGPIFEDGVRFVDLSALSDPALVTDAVAMALGLHDVQGQPLDATLSNFLRGKHLLLVLDNCEHVLEAPATLANTLLRAQGSEHLRILATSRQALGIAGETIWPVPPLAVPDPRSSPGTDEIGASEGVRLFCQRAQSALPSFVLTDHNASAVARICQYLDGLPLAIELAAARVRLLAPQQILERLDDRLRLLVGGSRGAPPRHQALRATLDWSHALLEVRERVLFRRLAVFARGWTLEAAEAVAAGSDVAASDVLEVLGNLVDRSLVLVDMDVAASSARYRLLETLREYALEKLREAAEERHVLGRHLAWYLALAERAEPELVGPQQAMWLDQLEREHDNLRTALTCARERDPESGLRIAASLGRFWGMRGHMVEGQNWLQTLLALATAPLSTRSRALLAFGRLAVRAGNLSDAQVALEESLRIDREWGDRHGMAESLREMGLISTFQGEYARARELGEQSLMLLRQLDDPAGTGWTLATLGGVARTEARLDEAAERFEEALELLRPGGDPEAIGYVLNNLGQLARARGDYTSARRLLEESLALFRSIRATSRMGWTLGCLSSVALMQGDLDRADALLDEARVLLEAIGDRHVLRHGLWIAGVMAVKRGQFPRGVRLIAAGAKYPLVRLSLDQDEREDWDSSLALARARLGTTHFDESWAEGEAMTLEEAIAYGLARERPVATTGGKQPLALTQREREVALLIAQGCSNREIAERLVISERTAEAHVSNLLGKAGLRSRAQLAVWLVQHGVGG